MGYRKNYISNCRQNSSNKNEGFTILELMVSISLLLVIVSIAVPSLTAFVERNQLKADVQKIQSIFLFAKGHAVSELARARVCWNSTDSDITRSGNVIEPKHLIVYDLDNSNELLRQIRYVGEQQTAQDNIGANCFQFDSQGRANNAVNIAVCREAGDSTDSRGVQVNVQGRIILRDNENDEVVGC